VLEQDPLPFAAGDADIGLFSFANAVDATERAVIYLIEKLVQSIVTLCAFHRP